MSKADIASSDGMNHGRIELPVTDWSSVSSQPRLLSYLGGEVMHSICRLKADAERLAKAMGRMADVDQHAVERGMIALRRATAQLEDAVTRNEVSS
ncbi:hypothetical protein [Pseudomonas hunanensis]|uniref:hypothetical protein n=1 Tax=Pseudomonas hunanensis TaxID=1247546 RepID=UPI0030D78987